jgi:Fic family protein
MRTQIERLRRRLDEEPAAPFLSELSPLAGRLAELLAIRGTLTVAEAAAATGANRNTIKDKLRELVRAGIAELAGKGRGAHYRQRKGRPA